MAASVSQIPIQESHNSLPHRANPCRPMLGKPTVATVPPNFTARLAATGNAANRLFTLDKEAFGV
jgi:hypothetical protein